MVEGFIARDDDSVFIPGAWVLGVKVPDPAVLRHEYGRVDDRVMWRVVQRHISELKLAVGDLLNSEGRSKAES